MSPVVALDCLTVIATYQRRAMLERAIDSARAAARGLRHRFVVVDGGSQDGTLEMLGAMGDVDVVRQRLPLTGAVRAYNEGFSRALDLRPFAVCIINDDDEFPPSDRPQIATAVEMLRADAGLGAVAFATDLRGPWACESVFGRPYPNKGVVRLEAGMAAARAAGDPSGKKWWNERYTTYAADTELGCWLWRLGWIVASGDGLRVADHARTRSDEMRDRNIRRYLASDEPRAFSERWPNPASIAYSREDAERYGGRVR